MMDRYTSKDVRDIADRLARLTDRQVHLASNSPGGGSPTHYEAWMIAVPGENKAQVSVCATLGARNAFREFQRFYDGYRYATS